MKGKNKPMTGFSRRKFLGSSAAVAALSVIPGKFSPGNAAKLLTDNKPDSTFGGVQVGAITYCWRSMPGGVENIIRYCQEAGISTIELMSNDLEEYLGSPKNPMMGFFGPPPGGAKPGTNPPAGNPPAAGFKPPKLTPEQEAAIAKYKDEVKAWRLAQPMSSFEAARKLFNDAGITVHIVKFSPAKWSDEEIDYAFNAAKAMGALGVTDELGEEAVKRLAPFAEKHGMYAIFHTHMQFAQPGFSYDPFMAVSPAVRFNFDAGHFFGSTGIHPNKIVEKYHDRIVSIHIKDKTGPHTDPANTNQVWGQGEMPLADLLLLLKKEKWPIYADVELEYDIKPWSNAAREVKTCLQFARQILI